MRRTSLFHRITLVERSSPPCVHYHNRSCDLYGCIGVFVKVSEVEASAERARSTIESVEKTLDQDVRTDDS